MSMEEQEEQQNLTSAEPQADAVPTFADATEPPKPMSYRDNLTDDEPLPDDEIDFKKQNRKYSVLKIAFVCVCVMFCAVMTALVMLVAQLRPTVAHLQDNTSQSASSTPIPYNYSTESSYAAEASLESAPQVSADENGPQIATKKAAKSKKTNEINQAYEKAADSIVSLTTYQPGTDYVLTSSGSGSGIIITSDGYIATNSHVVNDTTTIGVMVTLNDGTQYLGTVIGVDSKTDVAVLKIDAKNLQEAVFTNSDDLYVGESVYAIGSPGGTNFSNSLTVGTVSALNRILYSNGYVKYVQTDAAINPGNSGGALIDTNGEVLGMCTSKLVATDYEGMSFAIPSNTVVEIINKLIKYGYVNDRGTLGIECTESTLYNSKVNNIPQGLIITKINSDSALSSTDVRKNDIITAINKTSVMTINGFIDELKKYKPGDTVTLTVFRSAATAGEKATTFNIDVKLIEDNGTSKEQQSAILGQ